MSVVDSVKEVAGTIVGVALGAAAGGPIALGAGFVLGAGFDLWRHKKNANAVPLPFPAPAVMPSAPAAAPAPSMVAPAAAAPGLPAGLDVASGTTAVKLMLLAAATGHTAETAPARVWLQKFQTSAGLPATGQLDATTRTLLVQAVPTAANLPPKTVLG